MLTSANEKPISIRHEAFARRAVFEACPRGSRFFVAVPPLYAAYLRTYHGARSKAGARASTSRLMKRRDVRVAVQWFYAVLNGEVPRGKQCLGR